MFIESDIEIRIQDRTAYAQEDHELKIWVHGAFRDLSCYRVADFQRVDTKKVRAVVTLKISVLTEDEQELIKNRPNDHVLLQTHLENLFTGKGKLRCLGQPRLIQI